MIWYLGLLGLMCVPRNRHTHSYQIITRDRRLPLNKEKTYHFAPYLGPFRAYLINFLTVTIPKSHKSQINYFKNNIPKMCPYIRCRKSGNYVVSFLTFFTFGPFLGRFFIRIKTFFIMNVNLSWSSREEWLFPRPGLPRPSLKKWVGDFLCLAESLLMIFHKLCSHKIIWSHTAGLWKTHILPEVSSYIWISLFSVSNGENI